MRVNLVGLKLLPLSLLFAVAGCGDSRSAAEGRSAGENSAAVESDAAPAPLEVNPDVDLAPGFRGDVHPLLAGETSLPVSAEWSSIPTGRAKLLDYVPEWFYHFFRGLEVSGRTQVYTGRDFSGFLPETLGEVGQVWAIDLDRALPFLRQFHPTASTKLQATGRRAGPNGGFAVLRAVSPTHLDIAIRLHAEFPLEPGVFYTPAWFAGELLVNRSAGTVESFRLGLPSERTLNATLTAVLPTEALLDIVHVERMELAGGDAALRESLTWSAEMPPGEAEDALRQAFYKFLEIEWVPFEDALAEAGNAGRPLLAVVLWGSLDDQSC